MHRYEYEVFFCSYHMSRGGDRTSKEGISPKKKDSPKKTEKVSSFSAKLNVIILTMNKI